MTYRQALTAGYTDSRQAWQRGYISRKTATDKQPIQYDRYGNPYVLLPSWQTTQYCVRQYLLRPATNPDE
ncbi:MAG TPA: hypothetical protein DEA44_16715 [Firmicutes bacterium]|nr:hypothetical protein [Bacillota bacterium]